MVRATFFAPLLVMLLPGIALAEHAEATDLFEPEREFQLLGISGVDIDTGWVPGGAIQVRFLLHVDDNIDAYMPGTAVYDWSREELVFEGDEGEGTFAVSVGVDLEAGMRLHFSGQDWELPLIGPYDLGVFETVQFTPYLLEGNPDRPARVVTTTEPIEIFNQPIINALIFSGEFVVNAAFDVDVGLACQTIDTQIEGGASTSHMVELEALRLAPLADVDGLDASATLRCQTLATIRILLYPGVQLSSPFGSDLELTPFELPVTVLDNREDAFDFAAQALRFDEVEFATGTGASGSDSDASGSGTDSGSAGNSAGNSASAGNSGTDADSGSGGAGAGDSAGGADDGSGCGCTSGAPRGGTLLFALGLLGLRRRRGL